MSRYLLILCLLVSSASFGQQRLYTVVRSKQDYLNSVKGMPAKEMVNLQTFIPGIRLDIRYATANNCTHTVLYSQPVAFLRKSAATALKSVQEELGKQHLELVIFDAYRPLSVTGKIWNSVQDARYAAWPGNGSGHNRGLSVDLTLADKRTGIPLDMGTGFDSFSDSSAYSFPGISKQAQTGRKLLRTIMLKHGFKPLSTEWWHFSYPGNDTYEVLDIEMNEFAK